jgi:type III secretory pathway lipoprotein EscJ
VLTLDDGAIAATKERIPGTSHFEVRVSRLEATQALRVLRANGALQKPQPGFADLYPEPSLVPTPDEERARLALATAGEIARSLERLPDVLRARVHMSSPQVATALDAPVHTARVAAVIERRAGAPAIDETATRKLVAAALDDLAPEQVTVLQVEAPARGPRSVTRIGPFTVAASSAPQLRGVLAGAFALNALLALVVMVLIARRRASS